MIDENQNESCNNLFLDGCGHQNLLYRKLRKLQLINDDLSYCRQGLI